MSRTVIGSCPLDCPDACAWEVVLDDDDRPVRLRGRSDHPFTAGGLCPKVNPWFEHAADPSRLLHPLRRVGPKGTGAFERIGWDEAIEEIADRLSAVIEEYGGAAVWPFHGTGNLGWIQGSNAPGRLWTRMGASAHNMSICAVAGNEGMALTVGESEWMDALDFAASGIVIVWGSNTLVSNRHLWPSIERARRDNGAPLIVIDPIRTRTADRADLHLAPTPGTDAALAIGLCAELVRRGLADQSFLDSRTTGWAAFAATLSTWTLQRTAETTGLHEPDLARLVDLLAERAPLAIRVGHGMQRHAHGGQAMRAISCVPAVLGAYDHLGGGSLYSGSGVTKGLNVAASRRPDLGNRPRTLAMTNLGRNLLELNDPPVAALLMWGANPMVSNPQTDLVERGLGRDDLFTVVIDIHHTETVDWADIVLPSTMQHEHIELNDSYNHRRIALNLPAAEPAGEALPHSEIFRRLASAMGYEDPALQVADLDIVDALLDTPELHAAGVDRVALERAGHLALPERPAPHLRRFRTPSGCFEFASASAERAGHGLVPEPRLAAEVADSAPGTLALIAAASEHHINSTFAGTRKTHQRAETPKILLHPDDAAARGLVSGDRVRVQNERGSFDAELDVSDRARPGVAATTKGWWNHRINATTREQDADMGQGAVFHDNAVRVEPVTG